MSLAAALPPPCHPDGRWVLVNPGVTFTHSTAAVVECPRCRAEWHLQLDAVQVTEPKIDLEHPLSQRVTDRLAVALALVEQGLTITAACRKARVSQTAFRTRRSRGTLPKVTPEPVQ